MILDAQSYHKKRSEVLEILIWSNLMGVLVFVRLLVLRETEVLTGRNLLSLECFLVLMVGGSCKSMC